MVLSKLLNLFFISTSSTLYAQNCLPVYSGPVQKIIVSTPRTCQLAQNMAEELRQVSLEIKRDAKVTLVIGPPSDNAGFDDGHLIEIPERFVRFNRYNNANPGDSRQPQIAVVHEYGHAIFLELLKKEFSKNFHDLFEKLEQSSKESEDFLTLGSSPKEQFNNLLQSDKYRLYSEIFNAYSELYADTVAIYYLNDPKIMFHGLYFEGLSDREYNFIQLRDFSIQHKLKSIEPFNGDLL